MPLRPVVTCLAILAALVAVAAEPADPPAAPAAADKEAWISLFDGKSLTGWKKTEFGGEADVTIKEGQIILAMGEPMTGVTYDGKQKLPTMDYEILIEATKLDGDDFFMGLTFPVNDKYCSLIAGGWGGTVTGLSSIDDLDAFRNDTTMFIDYKKGQLYRFRVRVTKDKLQAWLDDKQVVDQTTVGKKIGTRDEVIPSQPFGVCNYQTVSAIKTIKVRKLPAKP